MGRAASLHNSLVPKARQVVYVATAQTNAQDAEWQARIERHQYRRPADWQVIEVPVQLAQAVTQYDQTHCLLIDSLGTWLANLIEQDAGEWQIVQENFIVALTSTAADVVVVAEETGWGCGACLCAGPSISRSPR